jgi:hypothetical protein
MSATGLHKLTAVFFAALYGVVGLTGDSLHYLISDPSVLWSSAKNEESEGYYHVHAPDYHGHYHRHTHHGHHSHSVTTSHHGDRSKHAGLVETSRGTHHEHACPLLALVSTLKVGHGGCCPASIILDRLVAPIWEAEFIPAFEAALNSCPRGPPASTLA